MRDSSVAAVIRFRVQSAPGRFWTPADFEGEPGAVVQELTRLTTQGELKRIRRGLYWRGVQSAAGKSDPTAYQIIERVLGSLDGVGPADYSASFSLGLRSGAPHQESVAVPCRPPRDIRGINFVNRAARPLRREQGLWTQEVALLEILDGGERYCEAPLSDIRDKAIELLAGREVRAQRIGEAALTEPVMVRERLRDCLEAAGHTELAAQVPKARSKRAAQNAAWSATEASEVDSSDGLSLSEEAPQTAPVQLGLDLSSGLGPHSDR